METTWNVQLIRCRRRSVGIRIEGTGEIIVRAPLRMPESEIRKVLESKRSWIEKTLQKVKARVQEPKLTEEELAALVKQAKKVIPPRVAERARQMGVTYGRIAIRKQKTRWGSCSAKGNLNFNCLLMLCPEDVLDYVIVHELCHRKELNHSARFWAAVERVLPDYIQPLKWLKNEGQTIISRI
ncbi:MAG: M48 family metallopeptidase [Clostridia bacterium]|nr:M48 family metallopeptidase [Clostridia bacterium]